MKAFYIALVLVFSGIHAVPGYGQAEQVPVLREVVRSVIERNAREGKNVPIKVNPNVASVVWGRSPLGTIVAAGMSARRDMPRSGVAQAAILSGLTAQTATWEEVISCTARCVLRVPVMYLSLSEPHAIGDTTYVAVSATVEDSDRRPAFVSSKSVYALVKDHGEWKVIKKILPD